jgi:hypothetical protein
MSTMIGIRYLRKRWMQRVSIYVWHNPVHPETSFPAINTAMWKQAMHHRSLVGGRRKKEEEGPCMRARAFLW